MHNHNNQKIRWLVTALLLTLSFSALSGPAFKGIIEFKQPDGSTFQGQLRGDEWFSWIEDSEGNISNYNHSAKRYEYSELREMDENLDLTHSGVAVQTSTLTNQKSTANASQTYRISEDTLQQIWQQKRERSVGHLRSKQEHQAGHSQDHH